MHAKTDAEHDSRVRQVLDIIKSHGITLKKDKCTFFLEGVDYLGHHISSRGIEPKVKILEAIQSAPAPTNKDQLRSFLGLVENYSKFVVNFSDKTSCLRGLLKKNVKFVWCVNCVNQFNLLKKEIVQSRPLKLFNINDKCIVSTDASNIGLGAVLMQKRGDGREEIIAFASRTLRGAESSYSTIEKEALALWWGVQYFRSFLWGNDFILRTDHKPLVDLFTTKGGGRATPRIAKWQYRLQEFNYHLVYVAGVKNHLADCLSRLPLSDEVNDPPLEDLDFVCAVGAVADVVKGALSECEWSRALTDDNEIKSVIDFLAQGWPINKELSPELMPFRRISDELSLVDGILRRGGLLVVPSSLQRKVLDLAHEGHPGIRAMKRRIREDFWWPGVDRSIEHYVRDCCACVLSDKSQVTHPSPIDPVVVKNLPWNKLALDVAGPFTISNGPPMYALVLVEYMSKWLEVRFVESVNSASVINFLREVFLREGFPEELVTDNGTQLVLLEMQNFLSEHGIKHVLTSLYHPRSNGLVERLNRVIKDQLQMVLPRRTQPQVGLS